ATAPVRPAVAPTAIAPVAPMHPIVRQMESERFAVTTVGEGPGAGFPAQPDQGKAAETDLTPVLSSEPDPGTPIGNAEDETPSVWPVVAKTDAAVAEQPAAEPPPASGAHWVYLLALFAGVLAAAGIVGPAISRRAAVRRIDPYSARVDSLASFLRISATRTPVADAPASVASAQSSVPFVRAPNLAWLTDEAHRQSDAPRPSMWRTDVRAT